MKSENKFSRPWGTYEILLEHDKYKVKRITVYPNCRLSLQYHNHRSEVWTVVEGQGIVTRGESKIKCSKGDFVDLPVKFNHRIENPTEKDLVFIEVQNGEYLGEDDIVRIEDDYNRVQ